MDHPACKKDDSTSPTLLLSVLRVRFYSQLFNAQQLYSSVEITSGMNGLRRLLRVFQAARKLGTSIVCKAWIMCVFWFLWRQRDEIRKINS